jgi:hypothetical protein
MARTTEKLADANAVDVFVENYGSIFLFRPMTQAATDWISEQVQDDAQWFGNALSVESRYALDLADGMRRDGLTLE